MSDKNKKMKKGLLIYSGGMDSTTLLYDAKNQGYDMYAISFDYGQRHKRELKMAALTCKKLNVPHKIVNLKALNELAPSALTRRNQKVPKGHYEEPSMKQTVVPNRNMSFGNLALAYALSIKAERIFLAIHSGDHRIYEDCRKPALDALNLSAYVWSSDDRGDLTPLWVASFFEAEGCFTYTHYRQIQYHRKTKKRIGISDVKVRPLICITQKDEKVLKEIQKFFYGRGTVYQDKHGISEFRLQHQDCRLVTDLMKIYGFKTKHKKDQFKKWYKKFKDMFEREVKQTNPKFRGKIYEIQKIRFVAPYLYINKRDIAVLGKKLNVDYSLTYTCYEGKEKPCEKCGACVERAEALANLT